MDILLRDLPIEISLSWVLLVLISELQKQDARIFLSRSSSPEPSVLPKAIQFEPSRHRSFVVRLSCILLHIIHSS